MTQPPSAPGQYPRQWLTEQRVQPGRSRRPLLYVGTAVVVSLLVAVVVLRVLHDRGEQTRAAYCTALREATHGGNLLQAVSGASGDPASVLGRVRDLAPAGVRTQWDDLLSFASTGVNGQPSVDEVARALTDVSAIVDDASANCALTLQIGN